MADALSDLKNIQLFANLPVGTLQSLRAIMRLVGYAAGEIIMLEGDDNRSIFFVLEGTVRIFRTNPDGREQTLIYLKRGMTFNLPSAFSDRETVPASAAAVGPVRLLTVSQRDFRRITGESSELALAVLRDFSDRLYHFTRLTHDLSLRSVRGRLAQLLLTQAQSQDEPLVRWTQEEIAAQIGTVREVVSRTLRSFAKEGLVKMERQRITVLDLEGLQHEAEF